MKYTLFNINSCDAFLSICITFEANLHSVLCLCTGIKGVKGTFPFFTFSFLINWGTMQCPHTASGIILIGN